jgi:hypothetical protein
LRLRLPKKSTTAREAPSATKGAKRARGDGDPWLALGHKSLKPSLAHVLSHTVIETSPSIGAFCTRGSAAGKAIAKNKNGIGANDITAAGAHGWALCREYWQANV